MDGPWSERNLRGTCCVLFYYLPCLFVVFLRFLPLVFAFGCVFSRKHVQACRFIGARLRLSRPPARRDRERL